MIGEVMEEIFGKPLNIDARRWETWDDVIDGLGSRIEELGLPPLEIEDGKILWNLATKTRISIETRCPKIEATISGIDNWIIDFPEQEIRVLRSSFDDPSGKESLNTLGRWIRIWVRCLTEYQLKAQHICEGDNPFSLCEANAIGVPVSVWPEDRTTVKQVCGECRKVFSETVILGAYIQEPWQDMVLSRIDDPGIVYLLSRKPRVVSPRRIYPVILDTIRSGSGGQDPLLSLLALSIEKIGASFSVLLPIIFDLDPATSFRLATKLGSPDACKEIFRFLFTEKRDYILETLKGEDSDSIFNILYTILIARGAKRGFMIPESLDALILEIAKRDTNERRLASEIVDLWCLDR